MRWNNEQHIITDEMIRKVESIINVKFPEDFINIIKKNDGGYPIPNKVTIDGTDEIFNNLVSFLEEDGSYIIDVLEDTEYLKELQLIPIAEDPFGNLFCYDFKEKNNHIVFWNHERGSRVKFVSNNFSELVQAMHD